MRATIPALAAFLGISACSLSGSSSPFGWFGGDEPQAASDTAALIEDGALIRVAGIEEAEVAPTRQGVIIRATGIAPTTGYYNARLVPASAEPPEGSVLNLVFVADPPEVPQPAGPPTSRRLIAALFLHKSDLPQVRRIRIQSTGNAVTVSR